MLKLLFIRFSSIGDIVLVSPLLRCIREQKPDTKIHFLVKKKFSPVIQYNPHIETIHEYDNDFSSTLNELKSEKFDYIIDLQNNLRSFRFKRNLNVKKSFTVNKINFRKWLYVNLKINILPQKSIVDRYFDTLKYFKIENDNRGLEFFTSPDSTEILEKIPSEIKNNYLVAVIGAAHFTKQIPENIYIEILNKSNIPVILTGGSTDIEKSKQIAENLTVPYFNATGICTLGETAEIIKNSKVVITPDTGSMHIAAAFTKPIVSLWGNTVPQFGMYPYMPNYENLYYIAEVKDLRCRPCSKIGYKKCPKKHFRCMNNQDIDGIVEKIKNF